MEGGCKDTRRLKTIVFSLKSLTVAIYRGDEAPIVTRASLPSLTLCLALAPDLAFENRSRAFAKNSAVLHSQLYVKLQILPVRLSKICKWLIADPSSMQYAENTNRYLGGHGFNSRRGLRMFSLSHACEKVNISSLSFLHQALVHHLGIFIIY